MILIMPIPNVINPIWETEEQARVRFKSTENNADTAPNTIVTVPSTKINFPHAPSANNK